MNKVLVLKTGSTYPTLAAQKGDFEDWIMVGLGLAPDRVTVVDVAGGAPLPPLAEVPAVVVTGSHAMVTEHHSWSEQTAAWLRQAVARQVWILGICYGHQLLAYALGGEIGYNPRGRDFGTVEVHLNAAGRADPLLGGLGSPIRVHVCHNQSALTLPREARLLGWSDGEAHQAFAVGDRAWGLQFHPEFDAEALRVYVDHYRPHLLAEGKDPDRIARASQATPYGGEILRRFARIVGDGTN